MTNRVGTNIDAWCTKCRLLLAHTIEAIAHSVIKRVICNTCNGKHQYKAHAPGAKPKAVKKPASSRPRAKAFEFSDLLSKKGLNTTPKAYNLNMVFAKGDFISHPKFGVGVVTLEREAQKIEVMFESGSKVLIHARS